MNSAKAMPFLPKGPVETSPLAPTLARMFELILITNGVKEGEIDGSLDDAEDLVKCFIGQEDDQLRSDVCEVIDGSLVRHGVSDFDPEATYAETETLIPLARLVAEHFQGA